MVALHRAGDHRAAELVKLFGVGRATVYRALERYPRYRRPRDAPPRRHLKRTVGEGLLPG